MIYGTSVLLVQSMKINTIKLDADFSSEYFCETDSIESGLRMSEWISELNVNVYIFRHTSVILRTQARRQALIVGLSTVGHKHLVNHCTWENLAPPEQRESDNKL